MVAFGPMSPRRSALVGLLAAALLVAGCGDEIETSPAKTPADFQDLAAQLVLQGVIVSHVVSGDAGCPDPALVPTAIGLDAHGLDQATTVRLYLYVFFDRATFERLIPTVDACARTYVTDPDTYSSVDVSPYVIAGQGPWGQKFEDAIRAGLTKAAGTGG